MIIPKNFLWIGAGLVFLLVLLSSSMFVSAESQQENSDLTEDEVETLTGMLVDITDTGFVLEIDDDLYFVPVPRILLDPDTLSLTIGQETTVTGYVHIPIGGTIYDYFIFAENINGVDIDHEMSGNNYQGTNTSSGDCDGDGNGPYAGNGPKIGNGQMGSKNP